MDSKQNALNNCAYFFELIKKFTELENEIHKQSGLKSLFKKINYLDRVKVFDSLKQSAIEAENSLPKVAEDKNSYEIKSLTIKLIECFSIYINMIESQITLNNLLQQKANNEIKYNFTDYQKKIAFYNMLHSSLETELPKLQSLYSNILKNNKEGEEDSFDEYKMLAEKGDNKAQYNLGVCYIDGKGVVKDYDKALYWFEKSANQGNINAIKAIEKVLADFNAFLKNNSK